jgi:hypothetical protein
MKITGLSELQKTLGEASEAFRSLEGEITTLKFNPLDPVSVEAAITQVEHAIDGKIAPYRGNSVVENLAAEMKRKYGEQIHERAAAARLTEETNSVRNSQLDPNILRQIENTITDLRSSDYSNFGKHIKKLARILHSPELSPITDIIVEGIDIDAWLKAGLATQRSMVGSARLDWPGDIKKELGTIVLLIDHFAADPEDAVQFAFTFYYNGNNFTHNLQNMARQMLVPFARDYINYVKSETGVVEATLLSQASEPAARKAFIVHGRDDGAREAVARYVEKLGFEAIILHEQANQGRTIIEKIEAHRDVGFAVVLLTPDDVGSIKGEALQPRARQNVLLELGYFVGRLGRSRV